MQEAKGICFSNSHQVEQRHFESGILTGTEERIGKVSEKWLEQAKEKLWERRRNKNRNRDLFLKVYWMLNKENLKEEQKKEYEKYLRSKENEEPDKEEGTITFMFEN